MRKRHLYSIRSQIKHRLQAKTVPNSSKQIYWWTLMWGWTFSHEEALLSIMDWYRVRHELMDWVMWITVKFYQFGLSFWRHPFTAEDLLVSRGFNAIFPSTSWMACGRVHFQQIFNFRWTIYAALPKMSVLLPEMQKKTLLTMLNEYVCTAPFSLFSGPKACKHYEPH